MRLISVVLISLMVVQLTPALYADARAEAQLRQIPVGRRIEIRLTNHERLLGTKGPEGEKDFAFFDEHSNERRIAFAEVARVKEWQQGSGSRKTAWIVFGVSLGVSAAIGIVMGIKFANRCQTLSCVGK